MRRLFSIGLALAVLASSGTALANGRFPRATFLAVGPAPVDDVIALQATFGLVLSTDRGASWHWVCEPAEGFGGTYDPALALSRDGALMITLSNGLSRANPPYCDFAQPATAPMTPFGDLSADPSGDTVVAMVTPIGMPYSVYVSHDRGASWQLGWTSPDVYMLTIDVAPGHPTRVYLTGFVSGGLPVFLRSDDGGNTFVETTRDFAGGYDAYIAFVDATNPDTVFVRSELTSGETMLLRSVDGGTTFHEVVRTHASMRGATISPDGRTIWVGSSDASEGILRSIDGGTSFAPAASGFAVECLRYQSGTLYACTDETTLGYSLTASIDGGEHFMPLMSFVDVAGPEDCATGTPVRDMCEPLWPMQQSLLAMSGPSTRPPRGLPDAGVDASADVVVTTDAEADVVAMEAGRDVVVVDAGADVARADVVSERPMDASLDAPTSPPSSSVDGAGCACSIPRPRVPRPAVFEALIVMGAIVRNRRRRGRARGSDPNGFTPPTRSSLRRSRTRVARGSS